MYIYVFFFSSADSVSQNMQEMAIKTQRVPHFFFGDQIKIYLKQQQTRAFYVSTKVVESQKRLRGRGL